jgi:hypothetical protein
MRSNDKYFLLTFLLSGIILFVACEKNDSYPIVNDRIIESRYFTNDTLTSSFLYEYEGERTKTLWGYGFGNQMDTSRTEIDYPASQSIVITQLSIESGEWNQSIRQEMGFQDDLISEKITYTFNSGSWEPLGKITWQYEDNKVHEILHHSFQSGNFQTVEKVGYEYSNGKIGKLFLYRYSASGWYLCWKEEYDYKDGNIMTIIGYDYFDEVFHEAVKYEFAFVGSNMVSMELFHFIDGNWSPAGMTMNYLYNPGGTLASVSTQSGKNTYKVDYRYEDGRGNYQQVFNYPIGQTYDILPCPTNSGSIQGRCSPYPGLSNVSIE